MSKFARAIVACVAVAAVVAAVPAEAASPSGGTLSKSKRTLKWSGGPYDYGIPWPGGSGLECEDFCDHFRLKVNMGQGARIKIVIQGSRSGYESLQDPSPTGAPNDFDLYLYDPNGDQIAESTTPHGDEALTFTHKARFRNKAYDVVVDPWFIVPGSTYKGSITTVKFAK